MTKKEENKKEEKGREELEAMLKKCEEEKDEYLNGWKRAKADFLNYKKEEAERFGQFAKMSNEALISEMLMILDSFNLGLTVLKDDLPAQKGMSLIKIQLEEVLKKYGLGKIKVSPGDGFNPGLHEGLGEIEPKEKPGTVAGVVEKGYMLSGKVIRPARVNLSKGQKNNQ